MDDRPFTFSEKRKLLTLFVVVSKILVVYFPFFNNVITSNYYCPQQWLQECNVFAGVCQPFCSQGVCMPGPRSLPGGEYIQGVGMSGRCVGMSRGEWVCLGVDGYVWGWVCPGGGMGMSGAGYVQGLSTHPQKIPPVLTSSGGH